MKNPRKKIELPAIDYGSDYFVYPILTNRLIDLPERFFKFGSIKDQPFHCFVDDWRIEAIWRHSHKMVDRVIFSRFACLPDYTVEFDNPLFYAFYQVWRSRVIGRFWQDHGIYVIPALQWSRPSINHALFSGLLDCEVVAVRSPTKGFENAWCSCADQFLSIHQPKLVLHFGTKRGFDIWPNALRLKLC